MVSCVRRSYFNSLGAIIGIDLCQQSLDFLAHVKPESGCQGTTSLKEN